MQDLGTTCGRVWFAPVGSGCVDPLCLLHGGKTWPQMASMVAPSRVGKVIISAYFDPAVRQQFAILAVKQDRSQAALLAEALNMVFEKYGEPPVARA